MTSASRPQGSLLSEFEPPAFEDWRKLVEAELKGGPFEKRMFTDTYEGIRLAPIYRASDTSGLPHVNSYPGFAPFVRGASASSYVKRPWLVSQEFPMDNPREFNAVARHALSRGLGALNIALGGAARGGQGPQRGGLSIASLEDLSAALDGIDLAQTALFVRAGASALPVAATLAAVALKRGTPTENLRGCVETDPIGVLADEGGLPQSIDEAYGEMAALVRWSGKHAPGLQAVCVHSRPWHESGGSAVEELAFTLATGLEYLRELNARGLEVDLVAPQVRFEATVGEQFFTEMAKIRALRMLWSRIVALLGGGEASQRLSLHVRTSLWNKTAVDPYNNLLRATVESFAAVLGGCDSLQVGAFDEVFRRPDEASLRISRNIQLVLEKECHLTHVIDPAGGSWYVESLTHQIAKGAWALFQEIEKAGGMRAALEKGIPQKAVAATAEKRMKAVARRRDSVIGVNQYANPREQALADQAPGAGAYRVLGNAAQPGALDHEARARILGRLSKARLSNNGTLFDACVEGATAGMTLGEISAGMRSGTAQHARVTPVFATRASVGFERIRAAMARQPAPAHVFLCNMGPAKEHRARAEFSRGFFAAGGFVSISSPSLATPELAAEAFAGSKARVAVICSTDERYPALVPQLVKALKAKRPDAVIVLAGYPAEQVEAHRASGIDEFIHIRGDALETLSKIQSQLGIS